MRILSDERILTWIASTPYDTVLTYTPVYREKGVVVQGGRDICSDGLRQGPEIKLCQAVVRPFVILRIVGPRIFESTFRDHRAKKLDGALRKSTSFV